MIRDEDLDLESLRKRQIVRKILSIIIGNFFCACALILFLRPNNLISGGVGGISLMINHIFNVPVGVAVLLLNIPLIIFGFIYLDRTFIIFSMASSFLFSFYLTILEFLFTRIMVTEDIFLVCIFGGVINGVGMGIMFRNGTCQGGLDILAAICKKKWNVHIGNVLMIVNGVIISISSVLYSVDRALYTLVSLFIAYYVLDRIQTGVGVQKQIFIISDKEEAIARHIQRDVNRGVTYLNGIGAYTMKEHKVIYCITNNSQMVQVKAIVEKIDPCAFMAISNTAEIQGKGFKKIEL